MAVLSRSFYNRNTVDVARALLGKLLVHGETSGVIVETEAYLGVDDLASHASRGVTDRTRVIYGPPGHAYVYLIYGMYECLNVIAEPEGTPGCVLIRAIEPVDGIEIMRHRRGIIKSDRDLASGPGRLTRALGITRDLNGVDLTRGPLLIRDYTQSVRGEVQTTARIGIRECADWPLRFVLAGNPYVSRGKPSVSSPGA